jgi:LPPG:FO 2-phospho-L-lactate transferase
MTTTYLAISGGVGGAKLASGLASILKPQELTIVANVADDFDHLGLHICPDLDSNMYALAGLNNEELGWGRQGETWQFMAALKQLGGEGWFNLGDQDLAVHVERTQRLARGESLSDVTRALSQALGIMHPLQPASDDPIRTIVETPAGDLSFQHYFVREQCAPAVSGFHFDGIEAAAVAPAFDAAMSDPNLAAIVICPSNPFVSVDPILQIPGLRDRLTGLKVPILAVSPIIAGQAIKGPAAKMMAELKVPATSVAIAEYYDDLLDGFVIDVQDTSLVDQFGDLPLLVTETVMKNADDRAALAHAVVEFSGQLQA